MKIENMRTFLWTLVAAVIFTACGGGSGSDKLVTIKTEMGDMTVLLYEETPLHKANFIELAESGEYDSTLFHRIKEDFMIQGGDIFRGTGKQETEADRIPAEIESEYVHVKGALAAARQSDQVNPEKKSSSCQFYIVQGIPWEQFSVDLNALHVNFQKCLIDTVNYPDLFPRYIEYRQARDQKGYNKWVLSQKDFVEKELGVELDIDPSTSDNEAYEKAGGGYPALDGEYTVFGRVVEGLEVIDKIAAVQTRNAGPGLQDFPTVPLYMSMEVKSLSRSEITQKYGYQYPEK